MTDDECGAPVRELSLNQVVAANIAYYRQAAGITQKEVGARVGRTNLSVSEVERSFDEGAKKREFDAQELASFAWALGVPVLALLLPPPEEGTGFRYAAGSARMTTAELLELLIVPNSDDDTPVMDAYRKRFGDLADRYLQPDLAEPVKRWLHGNPDEAADMFHRWAQEQRQAADRLDQIAAVITRGKP